MPWQTSSIVLERQGFALAALRSLKPFARLCAEYAISRKTGYKWLARYRAGGAGARSFAPAAALRAAKAGALEALRAAGAPGPSALGCQKDSRPPARAASPCAAACAAHHWPLAARAGSGGLALADARGAPGADPPCRIPA